MPVHASLKNLRLWADVDIMDSPVRNQVKEIIDNDLPKDSPQILEELDGKYSPFKKYFSNLGKTNIDLLKTEKKLTSTIYVVLAVTKFKRLIKKKE